jgi:hypothetical protein
VKVMLPQCRMAAMSRRREVMVSVAKPIVACARFFAVRV